MQLIIYQDSACESATHVRVLLGGKVVNGAAPARHEHGTLPYTLPEINHVGDRPWSDACREEMPNRRHLCTRTQALTMGQSNAALPAQLTVSSIIEDINRIQRYVGSLSKIHGRPRVRPLLKFNE